MHKKGPAAKKQPVLFVSSHVELVTYKHLIVAGVITQSFMTTFVFPGIARVCLFGFSRHFLRFTVVTQHDLVEFTEVEPFPLHF